MKKSIQRLKPFDAEHKCLNAIVETPKGSRVKYAYDPKSGFFILSKALPEGMVFPFNFGFIPGTLAEDGDPLDVLILNEEQLVCGCLLKVRPIAVIKATQTEKGAPFEMIGSSAKPSARKPLSNYRLSDWKKTRSRKSSFSLPRRPQESL